MSSFDSEELSQVSNLSDKFQVLQKSLESKFFLLNPSRDSSPQYQVSQMRGLHLFGRLQRPDSGVLHMFLLVFLNHHPLHDNEHISSSILSEALQL